MNDVNTDSGLDPRAAVRPHWSALALWLLPALLEAVVLARMASWAQRTLVATPLSPLLLGAACGAAVVVLAQYVGTSSPGALRLGAVLVALGCVAAEHLFYYLDYRDGFSEAIAQHGDPLLLQAAIHARPASFAEFLRAGAARSFGVFPGWLWWIIDAALTIVASVTMVVIMPLSFHNRPLLNRKRLTEP